MSGSDIIERARRYWVAKAAGRDMPDWPDIDPADLARILPNIAVVAVETPFRAYYRLAGTLIEAVRGRLTGFHLDEIAHLPEASRATLANALETSAYKRRPAAFNDVLVCEDGAQHAIAGAVFPLSPAGGRVHRCLVVEDYGVLSSDGLSRRWGLE